MARPRSELARQKALQAAVELVVEAGVDGFSVEEVTRRSGVAKTTIYRHWGASQDLLFEALNSMVEPEPEPDTGSLVTDLEAFVDYLLAMQTEIQSTHRQVVAGLFAASTMDRRSEQLLRRMFEYRSQPVRVALGRARERGELSAGVDITLAADLLMGPILFRVLLRGDTFADDEIRALMNFVLTGLGVDPKRRSQGRR
ncbi:MAG: TetR/AcrR family transcriptional regulator [Acidimicrobiia bacterium]|nr:TetR/AcrR family transcriptional regulator [Acidimicrobiia bacterium]